MSTMTLNQTRPRRSLAPRWRYAIGIGLVLLSAALLWDGAKHRPLPPASGQELHGHFETAVAPAAGSLRIASFNIHGCRDAHGHFDMQRTVDALQGFDLIGLNEVHGAWQWQQADQAELLGRRLERNWLFAPTTWRWWRDDFGNGLLTRLNVTQWQRIPLAGTRHKGYRNRVVAQVRHGEATVQVMITHLDRVQDRAAQLKEVGAVFLALPEPALLMGDLNTMADDPDMAVLLATPGVHDLVAEGMARPAPRRIDWILGRGLRGVAGGVIDTGASDHPLVWAEAEESRDKSRESRDKSRESRARVD